MDRFTFSLPDIGEGISEAEVVEWHVKVGDMVAEDDRLADVMTDKATVEMESPVAGRILELGCAAGDVIAIGSTLVLIETDDAIGDPEAAAELVSDLPREDAHLPKPEPQEPPIAEHDQDGPENTADAENNSPMLAEPSAGRGKVLASPAVRKRAHDLGVDLSEIAPGVEARVRHGDLDAFIAYNRAYAPVSGAGQDEQIKVIGMRRRIADKMSESKRRIPHFSYVEECDVTALEDMRAQLNDSRGDKPKLTILPFLIAAICKAVPDFPMINAHFDDDAGVMTRFGAVHMGVATRTDRGLVVPVIRDAGSRNIWQLANEIRRLADAARDGSARSEELSGSTLTVTSLGPMGGVAATPVINRPEAAIIGPNRIIERPVFVPIPGGGEHIEKRKLMNISISCDHRVIDGWDAASFVQAVRALIERPANLLI